MNIVRLGDICKVISGSTPKREIAEYWGGAIPWVTPKEISRLASPFLWDSAEKITEAGFRACSTTMLPVDSLLLSSRAPIGLLAINKIPVCTNQGFKSLIPSKEVNIEYLYYVLKANVSSLQAKGNGATFKELAKPAVENFEIPVPPLENQIRIAHLLGIVEGLIVQRKQHLQQLDDLLKSVFLEMFGPSSPGYNTWPLEEVRDLAAKHKGAMRTGPFGSNLLHSEFAAEGDVAVLGIDNAVQNRFAWSERRFITNKKYRELESYRVYPGDVIVTIMGTIGRSAVVPSNIPLAINTKHLAAITLNREIANPLFLSYSIHSSPFILNQFKSKNRGAIMSGLNLGIIKETKLKRPPIELQNKFAETHTRIDELKAMYQQSLTDLEALYGTLSQQAFKGELDLSHIPLIQTTRRVTPP